MKKLILLLLSSLMFFGCTKIITFDGRIIEPKAFIDFEKIADDSRCAIYKDKYSGVLYLEKGYKMTAIMKADGMCLTWDEWVKHKIDTEEE